MAKENTEVETPGTEELEELAQEQENESAIVTENEAQPNNSLSEKDIIRIVDERNKLAQEADTVDEVETPQDEEKRSSLLLPIIGGVSLIGIIVIGARVMGSNKVEIDPQIEQEALNGVDGSVFNG